MDISNFINKVHHGDCIEFMKKLPENCVDLVVTDSPYGFNFSNNHCQNRRDPIANDDFKDTKPLMEEYYKECFRIMKPDTAIYSFCSWHYVDFFKQEMEKYFNLKNMIIAVRSNFTGGDLDAAFGYKFDIVMFGYKGRGKIRGKRLTDVRDMKKVPSSKYDHPTIKPVDLLMQFVTSNSDSGDIVFDGFVGSGSTGVAAIQAGRRFIGCELEEKHCKTAQSRIDEALNHNSTVGRLFSIE